MNIFYLDSDPKLCAQYHVDKHCVKMILETAQLLSTAHRVLDGVQDGKSWKLSDSRDVELYKATHINHPSAVWARQSRANYNWLVSLMEELCKEYTYRYGKTHKCEAMISTLTYGPRNISVIKPFIEPTPAMPDQYKVPGNSIQSYKNYYNGEKQRMFSWKKREQPEWIICSQST